MPWRLHVGAQQVEQLSSRDDVQPRCGLIEDEHIGFVAHGDDRLEFRCHPGRELLHLLVRRQSEALEQGSA